MEEEQPTAMDGLVLECSACGGMIRQQIYTPRKLAQWNRYGRVCPRCILRAWHQSRRLGP